MSYSVPVLLASMASPVFAKPTIYECNLDVDFIENWIPTQVIIAHEPGSKEATVNDPIIQGYLGEPQPATVTEDTDSRVTFVWLVEGARDNLGQLIPIFRYRATYLKDANIISILAKPQGYGNNYTGKGSCKIS